VSSSSASNATASPSSGTEGASKRKGRQKAQQTQRRQPLQVKEPKHGGLHRSCAPMAEMLATASEFANDLGLNASWVEDLSCMPFSLRLAQSM
jgi:hypothetical protein